MPVIARLRLGGELAPDGLRVICIHLQVSVAGLGKADHMCMLVGTDGPSEIIIFLHVQTASREDSEAAHTQVDAIKPTT